MKKLTALLTLFCLITTVLSGCVLPVEETTDTETETTAETVTVTETETETETEEIKQDEKMKRYFIFRIWNFRVREINEFKSIVDTAANTGFNAIKVHMPWHLIQDENGNIDYSAFDEMLDYVINVKGLPVAVSIDFARRYGDKMLSDDEIQRDNKGNLCVGDVNYKRAALSFASDTATEKAVTFYKDAVSHFDGKYGKNILFYLPAFTQYCETEYWCAGQYDYSDAAVSKFRSELSEKYGSIDKLNEATKKKYASFDEVEAPSCGSSDALGTLWYNFRHEMLKSFIDRLAAAQKEVAPESKITIQLGSVFDEATYLRCTYRFADLCENADIVWFDDAPLYDHNFSMDYVRSSLPEHVLIAQEIDGPRQYNASEEAYLNQGLISYQRGAAFLSVANWEIDDYYFRYEDVFKKIIETWLCDDPPEVIEIKDDTPTQKIKLSEMFKKKSPSSFITKYNKALTDGGAVKITVVDDLK